MDLGLAMLQRWWRAAYLSQAAVLGAFGAAAACIGWWVAKPWLAFFLIWWLKPVYDRAALHVLSRAVFGELQHTGAVLRGARQWLATGVLGALTGGRVDAARSFNLPVRQLEGSRGRTARERRTVLGRRARGSAVWLTIVCVHFEMILYWSLELFVSMLLPAKALQGRDFFESLTAGEAWGWGDVIAYAGAVFLVEPFYVAAGFALYLNRRTLLEGWDLEVALRRLAERHAAVAAAFLIAVACVIAPSASYAQKDAKQEIAEVLKAPEFPQERETTRWMPRNRAEAPEERERPGFVLGGWIAQAARVLLWALIGVGAAFLAWWLYRMLPRASAPRPEPYRPPGSLFGMELAPQSLPPDVAASACALAREGKLREALALLYRGTLARLVHQRGVQLLAGHTELEVLHMAPPASERYVRELIEAWRACAYASRPPAASTIVDLAQGYAAL